VPCDDVDVVDDFERCYRAVQSRDDRFDGWFFTAVTSTRVYCRPSCPAITPKRQNVRFYPTAAAAQRAGFRACLRCRPDAVPGSPEWLGRKDVASRAVRLVLDGIVDREGVAGLARRLGYSERQLHRVLVDEIGTGAMPLARAQRGQTARLLLETTDLAVAQVAFAAGFASVRQFNDTVKEIFARTPTELRRSAAGRCEVVKGTGEQAAVAAPAIRLRLAYRRPLAANELFEFLGRRAIPGIEAFDGTVLSRSLRLPHGDGTVELTPGDGHVNAVFSLGDLRDLATAVTRCRHLLNLDADPVAVDRALGRDPLLRPLVRRVPGRRVAGSTDGFEMAVRAVVGQQVSVAGARTVLGRLVALAGRRLSEPRGPITHRFPSPDELCEAISKEPGTLPMPSRRRLALHSLAEVVAQGRLVIDAGADPEELEAGLLTLPGIGPWTASYVKMRALGDPDAFLATDLGLRRAIAGLGEADDPASVVTLAANWRPWRAYALSHLWALPMTPDKNMPGNHLPAKNLTAKNMGESAA
jgi:AraC family transcriptional regulator of adaptative response / DNA-3-methyladenine glycosylase II